MKHKEYFKDFDDFDHESQQLLKQIYDNKQILNVKAISGGIWKNTYKNTPAEQPATQDDYSDDFYGSKGDEGIKLPDLVEFLRRGDPSLKFDWTKFKAQQSSMSFPNSYGFSTEIKLSGNIPFNYTNDKGKKVQTNITGLMNKRIDYIEDAPYFSLNVDSKSKYLNCSLIYFYQNTAQYRQQIPLTASKADFTVNNKYKAVQFSSNNLDDLANLAKNLENENAWFKESVNKHFLPLLRKEDTVDGLIFLYRSSPDWVLQNLTAEELWAHLITFFNYDENHGFKDASDVLVKTLLGYNSVEKLTFLFDKLNADQAFIKRIYRALDGNAVFQDQELPTKTIFSSFLVSLCYMNMAKCKVRNKVFKIGKDYKIDSNVDSSNDRFKDQYFLQQQEVEHNSYNTGVFSSPYSGPSIGVVDKTDNLDAGYYYYPLELVTLEDVAETAEPETKDAKPKKAEPKKMLVPAIFVKDIAHLTEFKEITDNVRLGVDIIVVALSVASLGSASPLVVLVSALDMAIAGGDVLVLMNQDKFSKEFLEDWNLVVMAGGVATAAPFLVQGMLRAGALMLTRAGQAEVMTFVKTCLLKAFLELKISNLEANTIKVMTPKEIFLSREYLTMGNRMAENGVIFLSGQKQGKFAQSYAAIYKGVVIEEFSKAEMKTIYNKWGNLTEEKMLDNLDQAAVMAKPANIDDYLGGKILKASQLRKYRGELKQRGATLILEEDIKLNNFGKIANKDVIKNFKPVILSGIKFDSLQELFYFMRKKGFAGLFDHHSKQLILTENPTEYLMFHEMAHLKHFEEIGDAYLPLKPWQRETYVFEEIWKQKHLWTKEELEHALRYVNDVRDKAGQSLIIKKL